MCAFMKVSHLIHLVHELCKYSCMFTKCQFFLFFFHITLTLSIFDRPTKGSLDNPPKLHKLISIIVAKLDFTPLFRLSYYFLTI